MKNSVLIIGIDGATWDLLKPWMNKGYLPTLKRLIDNGSGGYLKTVIPPLSCSAWVSLFTGKNPGKHGIYDYLTDSGKLVNSKSIKSEKIWQTLSASGKRCCVINVILTHPVEEINGYMVSGFLTPKDEKVYSYPSELMSILKKNNYKIMCDFIPDQKEVSEKRFQFLAELYDTLEKRYLTLNQFMDEKWDFFMVVFEETGILQGFFWDKPDVMLQYFKKVDSYIDGLITKFSSKNENPYTFMVSDHGFNAAPQRYFNFRVWMDENGYIKDKRNFLHKSIPKIYRILTKLKLSKPLFLFKKPKEIRESFQRKLTGRSDIYYRNPGKI